MWMGRVSGVLTLVWLAGCGGGAAPAEGAKAPEEATPKAEEPAAKPEEPATEKPESAPSEATSEAPTVALEGKDLEAALQALFGDPGLIGYLHLDKPGRAPLKVFGEKLPPKLGVIVGSHQVKVVAEPKSKKDPVLVFTKLERTGDEAKVFYRYDIEGVEGRATIVKAGEKWELKANRLVEK